MKPTEEQTRELLDALFRDPKNRVLWTMPVNEFLQALAMISLDDLISKLEVGCSE